MSERIVDNREKVMLAPDDIYYLSREAVQDAIGGVLSSDFESVNPEDNFYLDDYLSSIVAAHVIESASYGDTIGALSGIYILEALDDPNALVEACFGHKESVDNTFAMLELERLLDSEKEKMVNVTNADGDAYSDVDELIYDTRILVAVVDWCAENCMPVQGWVDRFSINSKDKLGLYIRYFTSRMYVDDQVTIDEYAFKVYKPIAMELMTDPEFDAMFVLSSLNQVIDYLDYATQDLVFEYIIKNFSEGADQADVLYELTSIALNMVDGLSEEESRGQKMAFIDRIRLANQSALQGEFIDWDDQYTQKLIVQDIMLGLKILSVHSGSTLKPDRFIEFVDQYFKGLIAGIGQELIDDEIEDFLSSTRDQIMTEQALGEFYNSDPSTFSRYYGEINEPELKFELLSEIKDGEWSAFLRQLNRSDVSIANDRPIKLMIDLSTAYEASGVSGAAEAILRIARDELLSEDDEMVDEIVEIIGWAFEWIVDECDAPVLQSYLSSVLTTMRYYELELQSIIDISLNLISLGDRDELQVLYNEIVSFGGGHNQKIAYLWRLANVLDMAEKNNYLIP